LIRETLERAFEDVRDICLAPPVSTTEEAVVSMLLCKPDVILVDLNPSLFGLRVVKELRDACPDCRIIVLSSYADAIAQAQMAAIGVQGFLTKDVGIEELCDAV